MLSFYCHHYVFQLLYIITQFAIIKPIRQNWPKKVSANVYIVSCVYLTFGLVARRDSES